MNYACEAAIGAVSGLRSFTGPAIIAEAANRNIVKLKDTPLAWLATDTAARASTLLAVAELIADKLPFTPDRTNGPSLVARFIAGAVCGMAIAGRRKRSEQILGAIVGGTAAIAGAYAGYQYRKHVKVWPVVAALFEDTVAVGTGAAVISALCRKG
jgi:uncharacterized membrane protein